jgi:hypothetical protein
MDYPPKGGIPFNQKTLIALEVLSDLAKLSTRQSLFLDITFKNGKKIYAYDTNISFENLKYANKEFLPRASQPEQDVVSSFRIEDIAEITFSLPNMQVLLKNQNGNLAIIPFSDESQKTNSVRIEEGFKELKYLSERSLAHHYEQQKRYDSDIVDKMQNAFSSLKMDRLSWTGKEDWMQRYQWVPAANSKDAHQAQLNTTVSRDVRFNLDHTFDGTRDQNINHILLVVNQGHGADGITWTKEHVETWADTLASGGAIVTVVGDGEEVVTPEMVQNVRNAIQAPVNIIHVAHGSASMDRDNTPTHMISVKYFDDSELPFLQTLRPDQIEDYLSEFEIPMEEYIKAVSSSSYRTDYMPFTCQLGDDGPIMLQNHLPEDSVGYVPIQGTENDTTDITDLCEQISSLGLEDFSADNIALVNLLNSKSKIDHVYRHFPNDGFISETAPMIGRIGQITVTQEKSTYSLQYFASQRIQTHAVGTPLFTPREMAQIKQHPILNNIYTPEKIEEIIKQAEKVCSLKELPPQFIRPFIGICYIAKIPVSELHIKCADKCSISLGTKGNASDFFNIASTGLQNSKQPAIDDTQTNKFQIPVLK